jgi:hypothetical protein
MSLNMYPVGGGGISKPQNSKEPEPSTAAAQILGSFVFFIAKISLDLLLSFRLEHSEWICLIFFSFSTVSSLSVSHLNF